MANNGPQTPPDRPEPTTGVIDTVHQHTGLSTQAWAATAEYYLEFYLMRALAGYLAKSPSSGHLNELAAYPEPLHSTYRTGSPALRAASPEDLNPIRSRSPRPPS
jgi:hypothetical protein